MHNFQQFIDYVYSFYGKDGLYDQNRTKEQIAYAVLMYLDDCNDPCIEMSWGDGDSLDRERVRDFMNEIYGPVAVVAQPGLNCWSFVVLYTHGNQSQRNSHHQRHGAQSDNSRRIGPLPD